MKKNNFYLLGMLALLLAFGTVLAACSKKDSGGDAPKAQASSGNDTAATTSSVNWEKSLNDYEAFVNEFVAFMKDFKNNPTDMALLAKSTSMLQRAQQAADSVSKLQDGLSSDDLMKFNERYTKVFAKMTEAMQ